MGLAQAVENRLHRESGKQDPEHPLVVDMLRPYQHHIHRLILFSF
jgi:hypothetical protein